MIISNITGTKAVLFAPSLHVEILGLQVDGIATDGAFYLFPSPTSSATSSPRSTASAPCAA